MSIFARYRVVTLPLPLVSFVPALVHNLLFIPSFLPFPSLRILVAPFPESCSCSHSFPFSCASFWRLTFRSTRPSNAHPVLPPRGEFFVCITRFIPPFANHSPVPFRQPVDFDGDVNLFHFVLLKSVGKGAFGKVGQVSWSSVVIQL